MTFVPVVFDLTTKNDRISLKRDVNFVLLFSVFPSEDFDKPNDVFSYLTINDPTVLEMVHGKTTDE